MNRVSIANRDPGAVHAWRVILMTRAARLAVGLAVALVAAACGGAESFGGFDDVGQRAAERIETEVVPQLGLDSVGVGCPSVPVSEVAPRQAFDCLGALADGRDLIFRAIVTSDGRDVAVETANVMRPQVTVAIRNAAVDLLNEQNGAAVPAEAVACPTGLLILASPVLTCDLIDADADLRYPVTIELRGDLLTIDQVRVGDEPRAAGE